MRVLLVATEPYATYQQQWAKSGIQSIYVPHAHILQFLRDPIDRQALIVDAIVVLANYLDHKPLKAVDAVTLGSHLRQLDDSIAMPDGRKWNAVPILVLAAGWLDYFDGKNASDHLEAEGPWHIDVHDISKAGESGTAHIEAAINEYRSELIAELDNMGFIVTYQQGRYRVGPAFKRRAELAGKFYIGSADQRGDNFVTVHRELLGVQLEVEQFEYLINKEDVEERELQAFFEQNPHFLSAIAQPLAHLSFRNPAGRLLVPDFILNRSLPCSAIRGGRFSISRGHRLRCLWDLARVDAFPTRLRQRSVNFEIMAITSLIRATPLKSSGNSAIACGGRSSAFSLAVSARLMSRR